MIPELRMVAWELTRSCNLFCAHCRSASRQEKFDDELSTTECLRLIDGIVETAKPVLILSGGEPLLRRDIFLIGSYAADKGLRVAMGTNGTLITDEIATKLRAVPVSRVAVSIDFPTAELQDKFRGKTGAFEAAISGITLLRQAGIDVQINSTITRLNMHYLNDLLKLALDSGAVAFHPFMLVPTGRGKGLESVAMSSSEYEQTLNWVYDRQKELGRSIFFKPTDAPHYQRIVKQRDSRNKVNVTTSLPEQAGEAKNKSLDSMTRGCLAGINFCFISHRGTVQGCGYLDVTAGNVRQRSFKEIWQGSPLFSQLRDLSSIKGKCGVCEYKNICGGCRARAYESTGDYLQEEPYCIYQPVRRQKK
ncbi:MAG TPA: radical SAM protein [Dehalococcoidia bacterium]